VLAGELDVRICLVVAQQDVVARLPLLDQVVLERQRFLLVVDLDEIDLARLADQGTGLGIGQPIVVEIAADAGPQVFRLADVDNRAVRVFVEINAGR
jgi:hypothetical protein